MRRLLLILSLGACSPEAQPEPLITPAPPRVALAVMPVPGPVPYPGEAEAPALSSASLTRVPAVPLDGSGVEPPAPGLVAAAHDRPIATFAVTDDGGAAVSVDDRGGMRLWPSLDGTHEPVVVPSEPVIEVLAIARDGDDVVIAAAGPLGQLDVIRTTGLGEPIARTRIDLARTIVALHATASGFVGLRDDQILVALDLHGGSRGSLVASPGERIAALAGRRGALLAFVQLEGRVHARWIDHADRPAWGRQSPALAIDPTTAALAPDLSRVAAATPDHKAIVIVDLETGRRLERPIVDDPDPARRPLGFLDDQHLEAQVSHGASKWWDGAVWSPKRLHVHGGTVVATDRAIVTATGGALTLLTPGTVRQLGFRVTELRSAQRDGARLTIADPRAALQVDEHLRTCRRFPSIQDGYQLTLLDGRHAVLQAAGGLSSIELAHPQERTLVSELSGEPRYEPATHLLAIADYNLLWLGHYSPAAHAFDQTTRLSGPSVVVLLEPTANHGNVAMIVEPGEHTTITEVRGIDFSAEPPLRAGRSYQSELAFWDGMGPGPDPTLLLGLNDTAKRRPSPDGALIAELGHRRLTLRDRTGTVRWSVARPGAADVVWRSPAELVAFGSGMATIDLATGALVDRQCGWAFGLWEGEVEGTMVGAALCEAP